MRLFEFDQSAPQEVDARVEGIANLLTILNVVIEDAKNQNVEPTIPTPALINMVANTGVLFDYNALLDAYENNEAVANLIKSFSKDNVELVGSSEDEMDAPADAGEDSGEAIARIAKRVATREIG